MVAGVMVLLWRVVAARTVESGAVEHARGAAGERRQRDLRPIARFTRPVDALGRLAKPVRHRHVPNA